MSADSAELLTHIKRLGLLSPSQLSSLEEQLRSGQSLPVALRAAHVSDALSAQLQASLKQLSSFSQRASGEHPLPNYPPSGPPPSTQRMQGALAQGMSPSKRPLPTLSKVTPEAQGAISAEPSPEPSPVDDFTRVLLDITDRFEVFEEIAHGAMGRIDAGWDRHLGRPVAIKMLRSDRAKDVVKMRFLEEAQVTGQLQHPNIITIYELGRIKGEVAFVMRRVEGQSLKQLIQSLKRGDAESLKEHTLSHKVQLFFKLCQAVAFAHSRGVIHRDIKPSNVMIGDFGDVVLLDWGLCKIIGQEVRSSRSSTERWQTVHGQIIGTPAYMSPEQALGMVDQISPATDVYGLGALLYHLLTLAPPFSGKSNREVVRKVLQAELVPLRERAPQAQIPEELERICLRCLERDADQRYPSASELTQDIQRFLEGSISSTSVGGPSVRFVPLVSISVQRAAIEEELMSYQELQEDLAAARDSLQTLQQRAWLKGDEALRQEVWLLTQAVQKHQAQTEGLLAKLCEQLTHYQLTRKYLDASAQLSTEEGVYDELSERLCMLLASRYENAVIEGDERAQAQLSHWLQAFDPHQGELVKQRVGALYIHVRPLHAEVQLWQCLNDSGRLKQTRPKHLKSSPLLLEKVPAGHYVLTASLPDAHGREVKTSNALSVFPGVTTRLSVTLYHPDAAPQGFVHIPAGTFRQGPPSDPITPASEVALPDYFISKTPVTCQEYVAFINALAEHNLDEARARQPRRSGDLTPLWRWLMGRCALPEADGWSPESPVVGVSFEDALAFCAWKSRELNRQVRLPSESEWEKAARGMDGRTFPWGELWDPRLVAGPEVWDHYLPPPVGLMSADTSCYGIQDLVGGVREWVSSNDPSAPYGVVCGGSFLTDDVRGRPLWRRAQLAPQRLSSDLGFRLAHSPDPAFRMIDGS